MEEVAYMHNQVVVENKRIKDQPYKNDECEDDVPVLYKESIKTGVPGERGFAVGTNIGTPIEGVSSAKPATTIGKDTHGVNIYSKLSLQSMVDKHIWSLVVALNSIPGVTTRFSCHGHFFSLGPESPFVIFELAKDFNIAALYKIIKCCKTHFHWHLKARILRRTSGCDVIWVLSSTQRRTLFNGKFINEDIASLACGLNEKAVSFLC